MPVVIQVIRNANTDAGTLAIGQIGFHDVDPWGLWIGSTAGNKEIAMKAYVNAVVQGIKPLQTACVAMTTGALAACGYDNGTLGVGATLTETAANGALAAQDGITLTLNQRLLVKNQAAPAQNGVYQLSQVGDGATKWILTRVTDMDVSAEIAHVFAFVSGGTTGAATGWVCTSEPELTTVGTDPITFSQFSAAGLIEAGTGLGKSGNVISVNAALGRLVTLGESASDGEIIVGTASAGVLAWESGATARTSLGLTAAAVMVDKFDATEAPDADNDIDEGYTPGSVWVDCTAHKAYICLHNADGAAVWTETTQTGGGGANAALSNLSGVAINTALLDDVAAADDIGSASLPWKDIWIAGSGASAATINFRITGTPATVSKVITIPNLEGTILLDTSTIDCGTWGA
jgi:hypothetical protein